MKVLQTKLGIFCTPLIYSQRRWLHDYLHSFYNFQLLKRITGKETISLVIGDHPLREVLIPSPMTQCSLKSDSEGMLTHKGIYLVDIVSTFSNIHDDCSKILISNNKATMSCKQHDYLLHSIDMPSVMHIHALSRKQFIFILEFHFLMLICIFSK